MIARNSLTLGIMILILLKTTNSCTSAEYSANGVCYACSVTCLTCTSSTTTSCLTCGTTRFLNGQTACQCNDGFVERTTVAATCIALTCSNKCLTCNNTATSCTSCSTANNRIFISTSLTCPCVAKYFDNNVAACVACHYSCGQCTNSSNTGCTFCDTTSFRTLSGTTCVCNATYYDVASTYICAKCNYICATCTSTATNCLTCGANRGTAPTCSCLQGFYDDGISMSCIACNVACQNCTNGTSCNLCNATNFRLLTSISALCVCMNRYYDVGAAACSPCDNRCFTCLSTTVCLTCNALAYRTYVSTSKFCLCMTGYYETSTTLQLCSRCDSRCLTCSGSTTNCLTCDATMNRVLSSNSCPCNIGFYENTYVTCSACDSSCYTCLNGYSCASCVASSLKVINSSGLCSCPSTMYFNTATNVCQTCNYKCATCPMLSSTTCLSCPASSFRTYNNNTCNCNTYYYDDGSSPTCKACHHSCNTCSSSTSTTCLTCNTAAFRYSSSGSCLCKTYYYDNGALELCQPCMYNCLTCVDAISCSACDATLYRTLNTTSTPNTCSCSLYYFQVSNKTCVSCLYHCYTCNSFTNCLSCDPLKFRVFNVSSQLCNCMPGYYDDFVNQACLACLPQCYTCTNATTCTSCSATLNRVLSSTNRCPCIPQYFDVSGVCTGCIYSCSTCNSPAVCTTCSTVSFRVLNAASLCICSNNYFDDGSNELCLPCSYACLTCVTTSIKCVTCDTTLRVFQTNWCACPQHFYDNNVTVACVACDYTCSTCLKGSQCQTCNASNFRTFDSINQYCVCMQGFYDDGSNQKCLPCNFRCQTCTNSTVCLTCNPVSFRDTPAQVCPCLGGYYDDNTHQTCPACQYTCFTCTNGSQCLSCESTTNHRTFDTNYLCKCIDRFYDDGKNNQLCLSCVYSCMTCLGSSTTCTSCNSTAYRTLINGNCNCLDHFYDNLAELCLPCHYTCLTCTKPNACTTCDVLDSRAINATNGLCSCVNRFWDDGTNRKCNNCEPSCLTCIDTLSCITCNVTRNRMLNSTKDIFGISSPFCVCFYRYYSSSSSSDCQACHYSCQVCNSGTRNGCVYCNAVSLRYFNSTTTSCLCNDGYYDNNSTQLCQLCNQACTLCTTGLPNSCTACSPLYYFLQAATTCYITCPNFFFNVQKNFTCQACSKSCQVCLNETYCIECASGSYLFNRSCLSTCPDGTYTSGKTCIDCPSGCKSCTGTTFCSSCFDKYYNNSALGFCFSCHSVCLTCSGPGQNQCQSCASPLFLAKSTCSVLSCSSGQYVDPAKGCLKCSSLYVGSRTCNISYPFSCQTNYYLINNTCVYCSDIKGYQVVKGICGQICGDGLLIVLQCDDGNNKNGDGCSSNCLIEQGWNCTNTGPSVCTLKNAITIELIDYKKKAGENKVQIRLNISLPITVSISKFALTISDVPTNKYSYSILQNPSNLNLVTLLLQYYMSLHNKNVDLVYSSSRRLEQVDSSNRILTAVSFSSSIVLDTYPPALYTSPQTKSQFTQLQSNITALSICILVLSFILVPKKMHLHALTIIYIPSQIFITYGLVADQYTDWVKYCIKNVAYSALFGGFSMGKCCEDQNTYYEITSQLLKNSGVVFFILLFSWILLLFLNYFNSRCLKIEQTLKALTYLIFTVNLCIIFTIIFSSYNTLYHYTLLTPTDTLNTSLGLILSIIFLLIVGTIWFITYLTIPPISKQDKTIYVDKEIIFNIAQSQDKNTENISSKRKIVEDNTFEMISQESKTSKSHSQELEQQQFSYLAYDYVSLYSHAKKVMINNKPTVIYTKSKYFLPVLITKIYLSALLSSFMQKAPFSFFIVSSILQIIFIGFMVVVRPFLSKFTNFRIVVVSLIVIANNIVIDIYIYYSQSGNYQIFYEKLTIYLILATLAAASLFIILEHLLSWSREMWRLIEPCLKGARLMGHRRAKVELESNETMRKSEMKLSRSSFRETFKEQRQEIDAFYARMLKKQQINKQYRRQRMLK